MKHDVSVAMKHDVSGSEEGCVSVSEPEPRRGEQKQSETLFVAGFYCHKNPSGSEEA